MLEPTRRIADAVVHADEGGTPIDALLIPGSPETLASLGPLLTYAKIDTQRIKVLGTGAWDSPGIGRQPAFVGAWYPAPDPRGWQTFAENYAKTYGAMPARIATLGYDAVGIAAQLATGNGAPGTGRMSQASLTRATGFIGVDGPVRFRADGTAERDLAVLEVQSHGMQVVDPVQGGFGGAPQRMSATPARVN